MNRFAPEPLILLVDDESEILVALTDLLEDQYRILSSTSPVAALDLVAANRDIAVIISDQRMPEMTGNQFLAKARASSDAEALLLTGYADLSAVVSAVNDGAISGYANKPWDPDALRAMVASAAGRFALRRALAFEQAAFQGLAEGSNDRIAVFAADGTPIRNNYTSPLPPFDAADYAALIDDRYDEEERTLRADDGSDRWTHIRRIPFGAANDRYLLRIERDETERRLAARRLHQSEKLEALGTLAGGIAHDFNNLLAAIMGNLELSARRIGEPERLKRHIDAASDAASRGSAITRRLLSFSRQRDLAAETFYPDDAIRAVEDLIVRTSAGRVTLRFDFADPSWAVRTDPGQFELAVVNLCINARDAMPTGGEIEITTGNLEDVAPMLAGFDGPFVRVAVRDTGTGIDDAMRDRVFEPFFTTKPQGVGTGLGLPMVRAMARAAGGDVTIDSTPGEGTTINLWLPRVEAMATEVAEPVQDDGRALSILIAEDDAEVRAVLIGQLEMCGHRITPCSAGEDAIEVLGGSEPYDLLITDYAMPRVSGADVACAAAMLRPGMPVLLVTGFAEIGETSLSLPVLTKPFSSAQLRSAVAGAMNDAYPDRETSS